jgi:sugar/nucleoside kinase (ribokinase family)
LQSLYQTSYEEALEQLRNDCEFGAVTRDKRGSVVINGHDLVHIEPEPVDWVVDATGARLSTIRITNLLRDRRSEK